jgi:excisionase family DNA binding protein
MSEPPILPRWLSVAQAAAYLGCSHQTLRRALHSGNLRATRILDGGPYLLDRADIDRYLERRKRTIAPYRVGSKPHVRKAKPWLQMKRRTA